jgi:hypothetical protein
MTAESITMRAKKAVIEQAASQIATATGSSMCSRAVAFAAELSCAGSTVMAVMIEIGTARGT